MLQIFTSYPEENVQAILQPWQLFLLILAGWVNRSQQDAIDYLFTENRVLRQKLGEKRILLNDDQRRRLAVKGKILGRKMLEQLATIVTPDTILRWHRELVAHHWELQRAADERRTAPCFTGGRGPGAEAGQRKPALGLQTHPGCAP